MTARDMITDLTDLTHPFPGKPADMDDDQLTGWSALCDEVAAEREAYAAGLRLSWEQDPDFDPVLRELEAAREAMLAAEAQVRLLVAYGREFTRPRPYRLQDLARAAGMSISGTRTAYDQDEIAEVTRRTGTGPARRPAGPA